jgi:UDP-glucose 4-epimerase
VFGEQLTGLVARAGVPAVSLRLTAPVGPGMPEGRILSRFVRRALDGEPLEVAGHGTRRQDYVDVRDIAAAVQACIDRQATGLLNIASGRSTSNLDLARACTETLGSGSPVRLSGLPDPEDGVRWEVSIEKAAAALAYEPRHSLADSIRAVAAELQASASV